VRTRVPGDVAAAKKGKERVVDVKPVTRHNSARVSCANRGNSGGFFANAPDARGSAVGRLRWAASRDAVWAALVAACARRREAGLGRAGASVGREIESSFIFPVNLLMLIQFSFQAEL